MLQTVPELAAMHPSPSKLLSSITLAHTGAAVLPPPGPAELWIELGRSVVNGGRPRSVRASSTVSGISFDGTAWVLKRPKSKLISLKEPSVLQRGDDGLAVERLSFVLNDLPLVLGASLSDGILQAERETGRISVRASAEGLKGASVELDVQV